MKPVTRPDPSPHNGKDPTAHDLRSKGPHETPTFVRPMSVQELYDEIAPFYKEEERNARS